MLLPQVKLRKSTLCPGMLQLGMSKAWILNNSAQAVAMTWFDHFRAVATERPDTPATFTTIARMSDKVHVITATNPRIANQSKADGLGFRV